MNKEKILPKTLWNSEMFGFSHGILAEGKKVLFVSGQSGIDKNVKVVEGFEPQCRMAFESIGAVLMEAGATFENVVKINGYLTDLQANLMAYSNMAKEYFRESVPAQTLIEVKGLALPGMQIEVEAYAII